MGAFFAPAATCSGLRAALPEQKGHPISFKGRIQRIIIHRRQAYFLLYGIFIFRTTRRNKAFGAVRRLIAPLYFRAFSAILILP